MRELTFDVIVATRNRPERIRGLVQQILGCRLLPKRIVVINSSDTPNELLSTDPKICYLYTDHKNQPYQRFLGTKASHSEIVIFLDDDVEILDEDCFSRYLSPFADPQIVGVTVGIDYRNVVSEGLTRSRRSHGLLSWLVEVFNLFTGVPPLKIGEIGMAGMAGGIPIDYTGRVQYFQGANMSFRREVLMMLFDEAVFDLYDLGLGKGEDKLLSMRANLYGTLFAVGHLCFRHPPVDSHYLQDYRRFYLRASFSRLYLSKTYCEVFNIPWSLGIAHYYWFSCWRLFFALIKVLSNRRFGFQSFLGQWQGVVLATKFCLLPKSFKSKRTWTERLS